MSHSLKKNSTSDPARPANRVPLPKVPAVKVPLFQPKAELEIKNENEIKNSKIQSKPKKNSNLTNYLRYPIGQDQVPKINEDPEPSHKKKNKPIINIDDIPKNKKIKTAVISEQPGPRSTLHKQQSKTYLRYPLGNNCEKTTKNVCSQKTGNMVTKINREVQVGRIFKSKKTNTNYHLETKLVQTSSIPVRMVGTNFSIRYADTSTNTGIRAKEMVNSKTQVVTNNNLTTQNDQMVAAWLGNFVEIGVNSLTASSCSRSYNSSEISIKGGSI